MPNPPKSSTTVAEVVTEQGIPKRTIIAAIARGELKAQKLPGRTGAYLIKNSDLGRWLAKRAERAEAAS